MNGSRPLCTTCFNVARVQGSLSTGDRLRGSASQPSISPSGAERPLPLFWSTTVVRMYKYMNTSPDATLGGETHRRGRKKTQLRLQELPNKDKQAREQKMGKSHAKKRKQASTQEPSQVPAPGRHLGLQAPPRPPWPPSWSCRRSASPRSRWSSDGSRYAPPPPPRRRSSPGRRRPLRGLLLLPLLLLRLRLVLPLACRRHLAGLLLPLSACCCGHHRRCCRRSSRSRGRGRRWPPRAASALVVSS